MLTIDRSVVNVAESCAGACTVRSRTAFATEAGEPPTVPDPLAVSSSGPADVAVTWNVKSAEAPAGRSCGDSAGPLMVAAPSPVAPRCESDATAAVTEV